MKKIILTKETIDSLQEIAKLGNYTVWLGVTETSGDEIEITEVIVPEQENNQITSTIKPEVMTRIMMDNVDLNLNCFGVSRGLPPDVTKISKTEEAALQDLSRNSILVGCISNKSGDMEFSIWTDGVKTEANVPSEVE